MQLVRIALTMSALAALGGCVAVPVGSGDYASAPVYYAPATVYFAPPVHFGPARGSGVYGRAYGGGHRRR